MQVLEVQVRQKTNTYPPKILLKPKRNRAGATIPPSSTKHLDNVLSPDLPTMLSLPLTGLTPQTPKPKTKPWQKKKLKVQKDKILAEAKEEQPFTYPPHINYEILKQFRYIDSPDSLNYSSLMLVSGPEEEEQPKRDKYHSNFKQIFSKTNDTKAEVKILADTKTERETKTETMAEGEAYINRILAGAKDGPIFCYEPSVKYEPLKRYIVPRFAFFDSSSTDWSSSSDSETEAETEAETETMAKKEA